MDWERVDERPRRSLLDALDLDLDDCGRDIRSIFEDNACTCRVNSAIWSAIVPDDPLEFWWIVAATLGLSDTTSCI